MIWMSMMDLTNNFVTPSLFLLGLCILNIFLWRIINKARESIRSNSAINREASKQIEKEETNACISGESDEIQIVTNL